VGAAGIQIHDGQDDVGTVGRVLGISQDGGAVSAMKLQPPQLLKGWMLATDLVDLRNQRLE
jgi:hypothetical protein